MSPTPVHNNSNLAVHPRIRAPGSSFATEKLRPLTQLTSSPDFQSRPFVESPSADKSITSSGIFQSDHSRRASMTSHQSFNASATSNSQVHNLVGLPTTQASMPKLTLGNRYRPNEATDQAQAASQGPHPYDLILPGEEHKITFKSRTMSAAPTSASAIIGSSTNPSRGFRIGARRFTQAAHAPPHSAPYNGTTHFSSALHARRYSSIAREPSAATVSRASSNFGDMFEDDDHARVNRKHTKADTEMLLVSFNSLLGRDGGGEAVGKFLSFILQGGLSQVQEDAAGLVKHLLQGVPTLQAAYVSVHLHELTEHVKKIAGLLLAEPDFTSFFDSLHSRFRGLATSNPSAPQKLTLNELYEKVIDKLFASPVYQAAMLKLIDTFCQLVLASEQLRDDLWSSLSECLVQPQRSHSNSFSTTHIVTFLSLLFSAIEQLTGSSIKPLVKHFISWVATVDDLLTKLALETRDLLSQPLSMPPPSDYTTHPFGHIYSPAEASSKLQMVIEKWRTVFKDGPVHRNAFDFFKRAFDNVLSGILGNSTFARFSRDIARVWTGIMGSPSAGIVGTGFEGGLECLNTLACEFLEIPIANMILQHEQISLTIEDFKLSVIDSLPLEISFSRHSRLFPVDFTIQHSSTLEVKDLHLAMKNRGLVHLKNDASVKSYRSAVMIDTKLDLSIDFIPTDAKFPQLVVSLPYYGGSAIKVSTCDVELSTVTDLQIPVALLLQLKAQLTQSIETALQEYLDSFFKLWFAVKPSTPKPLPKSHPSKSIGTKPTLIPLPETYANSRDIFKASIRNLTGLRTDNVLNQLQNPLSGAASPLMSPQIEEDLQSKRKRRQSMADSLTNISKADSTLTENIQRPPVAEPQHRNINQMNLPNVFDEDEDDLPQEFPTMARSLSISALGDTTSVDKIIQPIVSSKADVNSVLSHRGGMPNFPMVEMSYEAYEKAEASLDNQTKSPSMEIGGQDIPSMAKSLSELATRDTTTEEAIANPPTLDTPSRDQNYLDSSGNLTMDKITRHLSGFTDPTGGDADVTPQQKILRRNPTPPGLSSQVVMADLLTNSAMEDNTLPETQATGHLSGPVKGVGVPAGDNVTSLSKGDIVAMRDRLSKIATIDTTLSENIAAPPGTQHMYRGPPENGFTGLKVLRSMSATLNEAIEKDYTTPEAQAELYRMRPQGQQVVGLTDQEMKKRRQSFKLTEEAMKDATLIEAVQNPRTAVTRAVQS